VLFNYQVSKLEVRTITGVVLDGVYHAINTVEQINQHATDAYVSGSPILLEIECWKRPGPYTVKRPLQLATTSFHKVTPAPTTVPRPVENTAAATASSDKLPSENNSKKESLKEWDV